MSDPLHPDLKRLDGQPTGGPLVSALMRLGDASDAPFTCAVLGLSADSRDAVLAALSTELGSELTVRAGSHHGLFEVRFRDRGFAYEDGGQRAEYDSAEAFARGLRERIEGSSDAARAFEPIVLQLPSATPGRSLRLLVLESIDVVLENPAALSLVLERAEAGIVVGDREHALTDSERRAVEGLISSLPLVLPVVRGVEDGAARLERGWWEDRCLRTHPGRLAPARLGASGAFDVIESADSAVVGAARGLHLLRARTRLVELAQEQCLAEARRLTSRKGQSEREARMLSDARPDAEVRPAFERIRSAASDELARLTRAVEERGKRATLAEGSMSLVAKELVDAIEDEHLERSTGTSSIKLTLDEEVQARSTAALRAALRDHLREDLGLVRDGLSALRERIGADLARTAGTGAAVDLVAPDEREIWNGVSEVVDLEVRYKGELPKRGFMQRLSEGRRPMYVLMMVVSMFGAPFGLTRGPGMAFAFMGLFALGFFSTYRSWKKQEAERVEKELDRARDQLGSQIKRAVADALREEARRLSLAVGDSGRALTRQLDEVMRRAGEASSKSRERELRELSKRAETLGKQLEEYAGIAQRLEAERSRTSSVLEEKERELVAAVALARRGPAR